MDSRPVLACQCSWPPARRPVEDLASREKPGMDGRDSLRKNIGEGKAAGRLLHCPESVLYYFYCQ